MTETRAEKFRRLAQKRAQKVAEELRKIGNLSSPNYEYTDVEVDILFKYIEDRLAEARQRFAADRERRVPELRFDAMEAAEQ